MKSLRLDKDKIKNSLTVEDVTKIMLDLGSDEPKTDSKGNPIYTTICHGGNNHKLYYYKDSKSFTCYTNCGGGKDIYQIITDSKNSQGFNYSFYDAVKHVVEITGKKITTNKTEKTTDKINDWNWLNKFKKKPKMTDELAEYNENVLDVFMSYGEHWADEGITKATADKYEIGYYFKKNQITIPNRDENGRLIGIRSRNLDEGLVEQGLKYIPTIVGNTEYRFPSMFYLYGLYQNKQNIQRLKKCLIFEGEKSVLKAEDIYHENNFTVATLGSNISSWQRDKILSYGVDEVFIAYDKFREKKEDESDEKYKERLLNYQQKLVKLAQLFTPFVRTYILYDEEDLLKPKDSPIDRGQKILEKLMKNKFEIKTKDVVF